MIHRSGIKTATKHNSPQKTGRNSKNSYSLPEAARGLNELELTLYVKEFVMYYYLVGECLPQTLLTGAERR